MRPRNWAVYTSYGASERDGNDDVHLGNFFGTVDEIALRLADKQRGFWCGGKLLFKRALPVKHKLGKMRDKVNVEIEGQDWVGPGSLGKAKRFFKGRPVEVIDCSQYGAMTLVRKKK